MRIAVQLWLALTTRDSSSTKKAKRPLLEKTVGKFTEALNAIADSRLRAALLASAVLLVFMIIHFVRLFLPADLSAGDSQQDYAAFYGAAKFALSGAADNLYDPAVFQEAIGAKTTLLWLYPPPMLFLLAPFGLASYGLAKTLWVVATIACAYGIGRLASGARAWGLMTAISPAAFATLFVGQVSAFFALLLTAGMLLAEKRPVVAGACFALLTLKPQYGVLVIPYLFAIRAWKAMLAATLFSLLMIVASAAAYGADMWRDFFDSLLNGVHAAYYQSGGHPGRITLSDAIKAAGLTAPPAWALYGPLVALAAAGLFTLAKHAPRPLLIAYALAASALVCPYLFVYDFFIYNAAILIAATQAPSFKSAHAYALAALWFAPIAPFIGGSPITPALLWPITAIGVYVLYRVARTERPAAPAT